VCIVAHRKVVEYCDAVVAREQVYQMAAEEAGAPRDQDALAFDQQRRQPAK
jgi:hypothetical protein